MFLAAFNSMFAFFMVATIPIPALRSFSLQVGAERIKEINNTSTNDCTADVTNQQTLFPKTD